MKLILPILFLAVIAIAGYQLKGASMPKPKVTSPQKVATNVSILYPSWWDAALAQQPNHPEVKIVDAQWGRIAKNEWIPCGVMVEGDGFTQDEFAAYLRDENAGESFIRCRVVCTRPTGVPIEQIPAALDAVIYRYAQDGTLLACTPIFFDRLAYTDVQCTYQSRKMVFSMQPELAGVIDDITVIYLNPFADEFVNITPPGY